MSRTTRKPKWYIEHSDVSHVNRDLEDQATRPYKLVKVLLSDKEYKLRLKRDKERYRKEVAENGGSIYYTRWSVWSQMWITNEIRKPWASRHRYERVPYSKDECIRDSLKERAKYTRDGAGGMTETGRNTYFKKLAKKEVRREWKEMKQKILKDEDYDKYCPHDRLGKKHVWSVW